MKLIGNTHGSGVQATLGADQKWATRVVAQTGRAVKLSALLDGGGGGPAPQVVRGVLYDLAGSLLATSGEVIVQPGQAKGWVDFVFAPPGVKLTAGGLYDLGLLAGPTGGVIRVWGEATSGDRFNSDTYADGASNPFGSVTTPPSALAIYASFISDWAAPFQEEELHARLPFVASQEALTGAPVPRVRYQAEVGWYGTRRSPERGAFAIVNSNGPLGDLVGERLRVTRLDLAVARTVIAYCHTRDTIEHDLSLSRRTFAELGLLNEDKLGVVVEVIA